MKKFTSLKSRLLTGAATAAACFALGAGVNAAAAEDEEADEVEEVVITGTRLTKSNISSPVPIIGFGAEEISTRGVARIEDITNVLPNVFAAQTAEVANGASGTATINLRALGAVRTLVLMDGKRLPFGGGGIAAANADFIPAALVDGVDVTTGGGSVQYGSDAVAGVVNFRLKKDFEGFEVNAQYGINQAGNNNSFMESVLAAAQIDDAGSEWGGDDYLVSAVFGANTSDDRGNVTVFASYQQQHELLGADRDTGSCTLGTSSSQFSFEGIGCIGSSNFRRFFSPDFSESVFLQEDGTLIPFAGGPQQTYNFGARNHYQRPVERWNVNASGRYQLTDDVEAYIDAGFMNNNTAAQIAESASFFRPFSTNCDNPLLASGNPNNDPDGTTFFDLLGCQAILDAAVADPTLSTDVDFPNSHRNVEGAPRISIFDNTTWRVVSGFRGDINENVSFDVFGQYAAVRSSDTSINDLNRARVQQALFVVDDGNGGIQCRDTSNGCQPWNIFQRGPNGESLVNRAATGFIQGTGLQTGETEQIVLGASVEADLTDYGFKLPTAENGVAGIFGVEYREDSLRAIPDDVTANAGFTGTGGATLGVEGSLSVTEFFAEVEVPLVQGAPFVDELGLSGGVRYSDYSTSGGVDVANNSQPFTSDFDATSWFVGLSWTPTSDIRFRANFSRAIRAPNVFDLFLGQNTGLADLASGSNGLFDPCSSDDDTAPAASFEQCARTGATLAQYTDGIPDNPAGQFNTITSGEPGLRAEVADTLTLGVVITPSFIEGLTVSVDYFDIEIEDAIDEIPAQVSLDECIANGADAFCSLITRDSAGSLWISNDAPGGGFAGIAVPLDNIATLATRGIDIEVSYDFDIENWGDFSFTYNGTIVDRLTTTPFEGLATIECAGFYASQCGLPTPEYRHRALMTWNTPWDVSTTLTWRHNSEVELFGGAENAGSDLDRFLEARSYIDLAFTYPVNEHLTLRGGINNLLAADPPVSTNVGTGTGNNNTYPGFYDVSRFFFLGATVSF